MDLNNSCDTFTENEEQLVLVDIRDKPQGFSGKIDVHRQALLHRAFSVMIYNRSGQLLIQKRANTKYHSARLWANSCCGHPRRNETPKDAAERRLYEELGFTCKLSKVTELSYFISLDCGMYENEYTHVFAAEYNGDVKPNAMEVSKIKWKKPDILKQKCNLDPESYAKWFRLYLGEYYHKIFI